MVCCAVPHVLWIVIILSFCYLMLISGYVSVGVKLILSSQNKSSQTNDWCRSGYVHFYLQSIRACTKNMSVLHLISKLHVCSLVQVTMRKWRHLCGTADLLLSLRVCWSSMWKKWVYFFYINISEDLLKQQYICIHCSFVSGISF